MDSVSYNLGRALAPVVSVLIFTTIGFGWAFMLNACSFFLFTVVLVHLRPRKAPQSPSQSRVINGFRIAWNEPRIMVLLMMVAAVTVAADPILVLGRHWPGLSSTHPPIGRVFSSPLSALATSSDRCDLAGGGSRPSGERLLSFRCSHWP